jgi:hypothetical protein
VDAVQFVFARSAVNYIALRTQLKTHKILIMLARFFSETTIFPSALQNLKYVEIQRHLSCNCAKLGHPT